MRPVALVNLGIALACATGCAMTDSGTSNPSSGIRVTFDDHDDECCCKKCDDDDDSFLGSLIGALIESAIDDDDDEHCHRH